MTVNSVIQSIKTFINIPYKSYDICLYCTQLIANAMITSLSFIAFYTKPTILWYNFVYNFGLIYNSIKNLIFYFTQNPKNKIKTPYDAGFQIGAVSYYFFSSEAII